MLSHSSSTQSCGEYSRMSHTGKPRQNSLLTRVARLPQLREEKQHGHRLFVFHLLTADAQAAYSTDETALGWIKNGRVNVKNERTIEFASVVASCGRSASESIACCLLLQS